jgi:hypothetical protein
MEPEFFRPVLFSGHRSLCHAPPPPNTPSGQLTPSMFQSKFMILLLQRRPGSSTSISSPSLQPLISLSSSLFRHPILRIIFNHLSPSHSFSFLSHTHTNDKSGEVFCTTVAHAFSFITWLHCV